MNNNSIKNVADTLKITQKQVSVVLQLLSEGATVPFISRYRKQLTGGLDEEVIEQINQLYKYDVELSKRKEAILELLNEKKLLTDEIKKSILLAKTKSEVENIYEPFKVGKKTKATEAIALGLENLAKDIFLKQDNTFNYLAEAKKYLTDKVTSVEFAIEQAKYIISQWISQDPETRNYVKSQFLDYGFSVTKIKKNAQDEKQVYKNYYDYKEKVSKMANHRVLAISRAESEKIISWDFEVNKKHIFINLSNKYFKNPRTAKVVNEALDDSLERLIYPSIEREIKSDLFERAQKQAIKLFSENLEKMLLFPAVKNKTVLAIDPAYVNGCKIAVISPTSKLLDHGIIFPTPPRNEFEKSRKIVIDFVKKYGVDVIVIGNGTASFETQTFVSKTLASDPELKNVLFAVVSEIGASVYSASKLAIEEFPDLSVEQRSAINIGRKFQDPLNELVKIDPKSIGVGQYQHDVNQKELAEALDFKVNKVVNMIGVNLNTATKSILSHISGLSSKIADNIIKKRDEIGLFTNRKQLLDVSGLGAKTYEQAVGFLRIYESNNFYDRTQIHPENYVLADKIVKSLDIDLAKIDKEKLLKANKEQIIEQFNSNKYDIDLIFEALLNPTKDIRDEKEGLVLRNKALEASDIKIGDVFEGNVLNITDFGIFVYIGLKESVFVHISQLSSKHVQNPSDVVSVGQKVKIEIIELDLQRSRISAKLIA